MFALIVFRPCGNDVHVRKGGREGGREGRRDRGREGWRGGRGERDDWRGSEEGRGRGGD